MRGIPAVVNRYLFDGDDLAKDMLERLFTCKSHCLWGH